MTTEAKPKAGLEDVVAASSAICYLDGDRGVLAYYGYDIHDLRARGFVRGSLLPAVARPAAEPRRARRSAVAARRGASAARADSPADEAAAAGDGMDMLRTLTSALGQYDPEAARQFAAGELPQGRAPDRADRQPRRDLGRLQAGGGLIQPDPALGHAANFLYMLTGTRPDALSTRAFDIALVLHADHELNASTFAARVAAATLTDLYSAIVGAIGALKGPAPRRRERRRDAAAASKSARTPAPERVDEAIRAQAGAKKIKIPGFGHRVYRTEDPRATHLRRMSKELGERAGNTAVVRDVAADRGAGQGARRS